MMASEPRILLVDDEPDILTALQGYLQSVLPHALVLTAPGGREALALLQQGPFDLLLSDYKMPMMDGLQLIGEAAKIAPDMPRIMMTAFPDMELAIAALNTGRINHFLTKPIEPAAMRQVVKALLDERRARQLRQAALNRSLDALGKKAPPSGESGR